MKKKIINLILILGLSIACGFSLAEAQTFLFDFGEFGSGDGQFIGINGLAADSDGNIYVPDVGNSRIQVFDMNGTFLRKFGSPGSGDGQFINLSGIAVNSSLNRIYVSEDGNQRVQVFDLIGNFLFKFGSAGSGDGQFNGPGQIAIDKDDNVYVADSLNDRVQIFDKDGTFLNKFGSNGSGDGQFDIVSGVALSTDGNIYVSDSLNDRVQVFDKDRNFLFKFGTNGSGDGEFYRPSNLDVFDAVYVCDVYNDRVQVFDLNGNFLVKFGSSGSGDGEFDHPNPYGIVEYAGRLYAEDDYRVQVFEIDRDGDGLLDTWEISGLDVDHNGTIDVDLPSFGADPDHKDLFLEFDWVTGNEPTQADIRRLKEAFAAAPIDAGGIENPDGQPGINLWVDTGNLTDPNGIEDGVIGACSDGIDNGPDGLTDAADPDCLVGDNLGGGNEVPRPVGCLDANFYTTKATHFNSDRALVFRYGISGDPLDNHPCGGGRSEIGGNDFIEFNHDAGTIMHEFGHDLNLRHGGDVDHNCKPNYVSVMSYFLQFGISQVGGGEIIDYSPPRLTNAAGSEDGAAPGSCSDGIDNGADGVADANDADCIGGRGNAPLADLYENNLDEQINQDATDGNNRFRFINDNGNMVWSRLDNFVNWSGDADPPYESGLSVNIDTCDATNVWPPACCNTTISTTPLTGYEDWPHIALSFRQFGDSDDAALNPDPDPDLILSEYLLILVNLDATDVEITKSDSPDPSVAGEELVYTLEVTNNGPNPASNVQVTDELPSGVTHQSDNAGCSLSGNTLTCDLGELEAGESVEITITVLIDADLVYNAGGPTTIINVASVENPGVLDPVPDNNTASVETEVVAEADLAITDFDAADPPSEILVGDTVDITLEKVITNYGPSAPMDTQLTVTAAAALGLTVSPPDATREEPALGLNELRSVEEVFTVGCEEASLHSISFTNEIMPLHAEDTDPDLSNNTATVELEIVCVVPVAINIKPGSDPNSINPGKGVIAVAILSTTAGQYGTPLAFDATTVAPLSVRFGTRATVMSGGGATETHNRGHIEDAYELDERTKDGDLDMVLHFKASETDIVKGVTEACVKGEWTDAAGDKHVFFGCDAVRTVGK